jgi:uncharacterized protein YqhQ
MSDSVDKELPPNEEVKEHLKSRSTWLRLAFMVLFAFVLYVAKFVLLAVALLQIIAALFTGEPNLRLTRFGESLSQYIYQIGRFLTYSSEDMPFPFADWPQATTLPQAKESERKGRRAGPKR